MAETVALTLSQRFHFDTYGYVLLENVLTPDQVDRMKAALYRLKANPAAAPRVYVRPRGDHQPAGSGCGSGSTAFTPYQSNGFSQGNDRNVGLLYRTGQASLYLCEDARLSDGRGSGRWRHVHDPGKPPADVAA